VLEPGSLAGRAIHWPVLAVSGLLEVRVAETESEVEAAQKLRYRVFYEEMSAIPTPEMRASSRDFDRYDDFCEHLLVVDHGVRDENGEALVVATYRLLRGDVAAQHGGFYTAGEYDIAPIIKSHPVASRLLELGRSCVLKSYRSRPITMQLLWRGILAYFGRYNVELMFGCGSLPGTDPEALKLPLSYLYHFHLAPPHMRVRALAHLYVEMNRMPKKEIDEREALRSLPPLIKGYVRTGAYVGDGAVIDRQFGTTDVLIFFPVSRIDPRWRAHFKKHMET
jgi:putative hemolysin